MSDDVRYSLGLLLIGVLGFLVLGVASAIGGDAGGVGQTLGLLMMLIGVIGLVRLIFELLRPPAKRF